MVRDIRILLALLLCALACGCGKRAGVLFPQLGEAIVWPGGGEPARVKYVGQLATSDDLKPGRSAFSSVGRAFFGKPDVYSMLTPFAVCTDGADRVFVADSNAQLVHVFDLKKRRYSQWKPKEKQPQLAQPVGIAWDPTGRLFVADSVGASIFVFDLEGKYLQQIGRGLLKRPCGLAFEASKNRLYVADSASHQVIAFNSAGAEVARIGQRGSGIGQFNFPIDVAVDPVGRLYVVDALNFRVQQFDADLKPLRTIGGKGDAPGMFSQPKCVDTDSDGHVYVVDNQFEAVQIFDGDGQLLLNFGREGHGPGEFWLPTGIFIDSSNRIWIADSYNRRVQAFDYLGAAPAGPVSPPEAK